MTTSKMLAAFSAMGKRRRPRRSSTPKEEREKQFRRRHRDHAGLTPIPGEILASSTGKAVQAFPAQSRCGRRRRRVEPGARRRRCRHAISNFAQKHSRNATTQAVHTAAQVSRCRRKLPTFVRSPYLVSGLVARCSTSEASSSTSACASKKE